MLSLALAMGRPNPDAMLAEMMPCHLLEWQDYYRRNPWGDLRADTRIAHLAIQILNAVNNPGEFDIESLMQYFPEPPENDEDDEANILTSKELNARYGV